MSSKPSLSLLTSAMAVASQLLPSGRHVGAVLLLLLGGVRALSSPSSSSASPSKKNYNAVVKTAACDGLENGMDYVKLGSSELIVSKVCMGTMTFGYVFLARWCYAG